MSDKKIIAIVGPTAVGKTSLATRLAAHFGTEIISADSRQVYKELEIGTAKPSAQELAGARHHFINNVSIREDYDAGSYARQAQAVLHGIFTNHDYVILCGGSGLYVKALLEGFDELPNVPTEVRSKIIAEYNKKGIGWLQERVAEQDPDYFGTVDKQNPQRLMRALEIIQSTGLTFSGFRKGVKPSLPYKVIKVGLTLDRIELYRRIDDRIDEMVARGLFDEAIHFSSLRHLNALQTVGYQEIFGFLDGVYDREEAIRLMKRNSRRYAKRQLTWFRKDTEIMWFHPDEWHEILKFINSEK